MKKTALTAAVAASILALSGCGKSPASASTESSSGADTESKFSFERIKDLVTGTTAKATVQMPATALIASSLAGASTVFADTPAAKFRINIIQGFVDGVFESGPAMLAWYGKLYVGELRTQTTGQDLTPWQKGYAKTLADPTIPEFVKVAARNKLKCVDLAASKSDQADACWEGFAHHGAAAFSILSAHASMSGWEVDPIGGFGRQGSSDKVISAYVKANSFFAEFGSLLETELAGKLASSVLKDPDDAKARILTAFFAMSPEKIAAAAEMAWQTVMAERKGGTVLNTTGHSKGVEWTMGGSNYLGDSGGWTITRNGVTWFGQGHANGKKYELGLESSIAASATRKSSVTDSDSAKSGTTDKASAGTQ